MLFRTVAGNSVSVLLPSEWYHESRAYGGGGNEEGKRGLEKPHLKSPVHMYARARTHSVEGAEKQISGFLTPENFPENLLMLSFSPPTMEATYN